MLQILTFTLFSGDSFDKLVSKYRGELDILVKVSGNSLCLHLIFKEWKQDSQGLSQRWIGMNANHANLFLSKFVCFHIYHKQDKIRVRESITKEVSRLETVKRKVGTAHHNNCSTVFKKNFSPKTPVRLVLLSIQSQKVQPVPRW